LLGVLLLPQLDMDWFKVIHGALLVPWCLAMPSMAARPRRPFTFGGRFADGLADWRTCLSATDVCA
jgi:hypothetical protein